MINVCEEHFNAKMLELVPGSKGGIYKFMNVDTQEHGTVPYWCLHDFKVFRDEEGNEVLDLTGRTVILRKRGNKTFPGSIYESRVRPNTSKLEECRMNRESLYEGAILYKQYTLAELDDLFCCNCVSLTPAKIRQVMNLKAHGSEAEQKAYMMEILGIGTLSLSQQESISCEYKSSFIHTANHRQNERSLQYQQIFKELVSFANRRIKGVVYIGVDNDGSIKGLEDELMETPFDNRADFQAEFRNQFNLAVNNFGFTSTVTMTWLRTEDNKLFCRIDVPEWNGSVPILLNGCELYVRDDAGKRQLKDQEFINFILTYCGNNAA